MVEIQREALNRIFQIKYNMDGNLGWGPRLREKFNYYQADDFYEAAVDKFVDANTNWIDVGAGRDLFPNNKQLTKELSERCQWLLGVDPDGNVYDNEYLSERLKGFLADYRGERQFDLVTLRMVAEHVENPEFLISDIDRITAKGAHVVIYTPFKWAPMSIATRVTPMAGHHFFKKILLGSEERDTFPVKFMMNTRAKLTQIFKNHDFEEEYFRYLDDCSIFAKWYWLNYIELSIRKLFRKCGMCYPELCLLAVYKKM